MMSRVICKIEKRFRCFVSQLKTFLAFVKKCLTRLAGGARSAFSRRKLARYTALVSAVLIVSTSVFAFAGCSAEVDPSAKPGVTIKPNHNKVPPQADLLKLMQQDTDYRRNEEELYGYGQYHQRVMKSAVYEYYKRVNNEKRIFAQFGGDPVDQLFYSEGRIIFLCRAVDQENDKLRLLNFEIKLNDSNKNIVENYIANSDEDVKEDLFVAVCHLIENADPSCEEHLDAPKEFINMDMRVQGYDEQFKKALMEKYNTDYIHPPSKPYFYNGKLMSIFEGGFKVANTCIDVKQLDKVNEIIGVANDFFYGYEIIGGFDDIYELFEDDSINPLPKVTKK